MTSNSQAMTQKVAVVTGSSSGMGFETSLILARNGFHTYATMRKLEGEGSKQITNITKNENLPLQVIQLDVNDDKSVNDAINAVIKENDRIDVVVNNAGYDLMGALEETSMDEIKAQFETNIFGPLRVMQAIIPMMRKQGGGIIVNITSLGGRISFPLNSPYHATKFALEGLSESIQYELEPFGIKIIVIEPGGVGSNFLKNLKMAAKTSDPLNSPYRSIQSSMSEYFKQWAQNLTHPSEVAKVILQAVTSDNPDFRYVVGNDAKMTLEARRNMSDMEFQDMIKKQINL
jgi:NAD(P)-dependent dehydrogenase (short-subunit alcohol dehydrogenase family)